MSNKAFLCFPVEMNVRLAAFNILLATDKSLAYNLREALREKIVKATENDIIFESEYFDTNPEGKGFRAGYLSFGLRPEVWSGKGLVGGILIRGNYESKIESDSPDIGTPEYDEWKKSGGNPNLQDWVTLNVELEAGYYNKNRGGHYSRGVNLGGVEFIISEMEEVEVTELLDPAQLTKGLNELVESVLKDPPPEAISKSKKVQKKQSPYSSLKKFLNLLIDEDRNYFTPAEVREIAKWTNKHPRDIIEWLRKRQLTYDVNKVSSLNLKKMAYRISSVPSDLDDDMRKLIDDFLLHNDESGEAYEYIEGFFDYPVEEQGYGELSDYLDNYYF